ncbi:MAG: Mo-dependent nitrogenase C-terminal domain-containing protein [Gomphosphaeria aponina SAG 52.96 = DSM 107014]|uniref:Mo-dependent nitrogenase C-terminal domain-containing protein n=1 Tax=Gomphosphaeria aponina SAG 52.96 = DSM 107014 TaxID=1521640 RepID=A0A941JUI5_9CHRO|nr:Mo-dependent nitrogenase C-terminal domain-containing protein [Gomphosphaeria aponina SAG 52.96 = DSM 107014]
MDVTELTVKQIILSGWTWEQPQQERTVDKKTTKIDLLSPLRWWINNIEVRKPSRAHQICKLIPAQCPFARKIKIWGRTLVNIPPLCKLNPLYEELMMLRFRAISYLAEECCEDVSNYC